MMQSDEPVASQSLSDGADTAANSPPPTDETFLRTWLFNRDEPCPLCGYNLRGLTLPRCPECWQALRLSVSLAEPYQKMWITCLVGLLLPAGFGVVLIIAFSYALLREGMKIFEGFSFSTAGPAYMILHVLACVPLSIATIVFRRRFLGWARPTQQMCAAFVWIAIAISGLIFFSNLIR